MSDEGEVTSADQDAWLAMARAVREQFAKQIPLMGAMKPEELKAFVEAMGDLRWLELRAHSHDKAIENELAKLPYGSN